jgi:hypothetical protein
MKKIFDAEKKGRMNAPNVAVAKAGSKNKSGFVNIVNIAIAMIIQKDIRFNMKKT